MRTTIFGVRAFLAFGLIAALAFAQNRPGSNSTATNRGGVSIVTPVHAPGSLRELLSLSPIVVIGTCEKELPGRYIVATDPSSDIVTDRIVRVESVLKGAVQEGMKIAVQELGGTLTRESKQPIRQTILDQEPLQTGRRYLLFLRPRSWPDHDEYDGRRLTVTGIWSGSFRLDADVVRVANAASPGLRVFDGHSVAEVLDRVRQEIAIPAQ